MAAAVRSVNSQRRSPKRTACHADAHVMLTEVILEHCHPGLRTSPAGPLEAQGWPLALSFTTSEATGGQRGPISRQVRLQVHLYTVHIVAHKGFTHAKTVFKGFIEAYLCKLDMSHGFHHFQPLRMYRVTYLYIYIHICIHVYIYTFI